MRVQAYETARFTRFIKTLSEIKEGNGNILDNSIILFGSNMANSDLHNNNPLPQLIARQGRWHQGWPAPGDARRYTACQHSVDNRAAGRRQYRQIQRLDASFQRGLRMSQGAKGAVAIAAALVALWGSSAFAANSADEPRRPDGSTPLQWAVFEGNVAEAARLIKAGADVIGHQ